MQITNNQKYIAFLLVGMLLMGGAWNVLSGGGDVSDNGVGAGAVTNQLDQTGKELQDTAAGLNNVKQAVDRSVERVERSETIIREVQVRTDNDAAVLSESAGLITDSQRIISTVRQRGKSETK